MRLRSAILVAAMVMSGCRDSAGIENLSIRFEVPGVVVTGESILFTMRLINAGPLSVTLQTAPPDQALAVLVSTSTGAPVWTRRAETGVIRSQEFLPGEQITYTARWDQRNSSGALVPPGTYVVVAFLEVQGKEPDRFEATIRINPAP